MYAAFTATAENGAAAAPQTRTPGFRRHAEFSSVAANLLGKVGTNPGLRASLGPMTDNQTPFADLSLERAIALRWALRDIKAKRLKLSPLSEADLATLTELGLIELREDVPVLTQTGHDALDG
jgi:hypothetical protein